MKCFFITCYIFLCSVVSLWAQPRFSSNTETYDFGQIEWKHPVTAYFTISNIGNEPLILNKVLPDCACTAVNWTKTPIVPGASGKVSVTFDAEALGYFYKSVGVMTNAQPVVYLNFSGQVVREIKDFSKTHPYLFDDIRLDKNLLQFADVTQGESAKLYLNVANQSNHPYEPVLMHLPSYIDMEAKPNILQKGEKGIITLTFHSDKVNDIGLISSMVYLSRFTGDKVAEANSIPLMAMVLPDFSNLSEAERQQAPAINSLPEKLNFSELLKKKSKPHQHLSIINQGKQPLKIMKVQVTNPAIAVRLKKNVLLPGEETHLRISISRKQLTRYKQPLKLLFITNDPLKPKVEVDFIY